MKKKYYYIGGVIVVFILGTILLFSGKEKSYYPDLEGWNRKALQGDEFEAFFPLTLGDNLYLVSPNENGLFEGNGLVTSDSAFIEFRDSANINLGTQEQEHIFKILSARRSFFAHRTFDEIPVFKIWSEQVASEDFQEYKLTVSEELDSFTFSEVEKENEYKDHDYYTYLRKDLSAEGLKGKNSIGGAYIFFPEKNSVLYIFFFNTRYNTPVAYLISDDEITSIVHEIIDSVNKP